MGSRAQVHPMVEVRHTLVSFGTLVELVRYESRGLDLPVCRLDCSIESVSRVLSLL